jgi:hypothetical protein
MSCPAGLIGRGETVSVIPSTIVAVGVGSEVTYQREQPDAVGGTELGALRAVNGVVTVGKIRLNIDRDLVDGPVAR